MIKALPLILNFASFAQPHPQFQCEFTLDFRIDFEGIFPDHG